jgi:hypothetical protein
MSYFRRDTMGLREMPQPLPPVFVACTEEGKDRVRQLIDNRVSHARRKYGKEFHVRWTGKGFDVWRLR